MRLAFIIGFIICTLLYSTCGAKIPDGCDAARAFFKLPSEEQLPQFRRLSLEKQLEYFTCDYRYSHPFSVTFANVIAERGDESIPFLADKLRIERDAENLGAAIYVLELMFKYDYVRNKGATIQLIRQTIVEMKCDSSKERCNQRRKDIERLLASHQ